MLCLQRTPHQHTEPATSALLTLMVLPAIMPAATHLQTHTCRMPQCAQSMALAEVQGPCSCCRHRPLQLLPVQPASSLGLSWSWATSPKTELGGCGCDR